MKTVNTHFQEILKFQASLNLFSKSQKREKLLIFPFAHPFSHIEKKEKMLLST